MTTREADIVLLESLLQTPGSRADYFRIKAIEGNHDPVTFYSDLSAAYTRIEIYVNTDDMRRWWHDENGNQKFGKQYLFLPEYTNGRMIGSLGSEYLHELKDPLNEFGKSILANIERKIALIENIAASNNSKEKTSIKSFSWTGSQDQLGALWQALKDAGYIDQGTNIEAFTAIFSGSEIDSNLHPVTWICKNRKGTANKTALREFLTLLLDKFQESSVPICFMDEQKRPISLNKPKRTEYSNYFKELEEIVQKVVK